MAKIGIISSNPEDKPDSYFITATKRAVWTHVACSGRLTVPRPTTLLAHIPTGWGHGGTRHRSTSRRVHTWSVRPAAMAGVQGRHCFAEPVPLVGSGCGRGWRKLAWGKQKLGSVPQLP